MPCTVLAWLEHWRSLAPTPSGFLRSGFDRQWRPQCPAHAGLVTQSRLIYNFAIGTALTGGRHYMDAVRSSARFLIERFRDPVHGGWFFAVDETGAPVDTAKDCYGHAFAVFGLAHAAAATGETDFITAARETLGVIETRFRHPNGGYVRNLRPR
ncbi:MAG: AGE family epimerase/isomerase [Planctomycetota bacterium]